jgi:membrane protease YdiL (CAAX protease family)
MADAPGRRRRWPEGVLAAALALLPVAYLALSTGRGGDPAAGFEAAFTRWSYSAVPWALGAAAFAFVLARGRPVHRSLGVGLMTVPVWETVWGILDSLVELRQGGLVFRAFTHHELSSLYLYKLVEDLGYLGLGFLLYNSQGGLGGLLRQGPREIARGLAAAGLPLGRRSEGSSALLGLLAFPVLLVSTLVVNGLLHRVDSLSQSDESSIYDNMTLFHAVMISLAAAFTEELVYRGVILVGLSRRMPMAVAVLVQAVVFGFAHGGYGTWSHIIIAALFGLVSGLVAWRFGLWAALALHFLVDLFAFGADASSNVPWLWPAIVWAFLANCALTLGAAALWALRKAEARRMPPPA